MVVVVVISLLPQVLVVLQYWADQVWLGTCKNRTHYLRIRNLLGINSIKISRYLVIGIASLIAVGLSLFIVIYTIIRRRKSN